jgi:hypothetical protein
MALAAGLCAIVPSATLFGALASAAGTVLEAAPFVVGSALAPRLRIARYLPSLGCGCGGALPAALSLPSLALCWIAFGPAVALLRAAAAIGLAFFSRRASACDPDPLRELAALGTSSFAAALTVEILRAHTLGGQLLSFAAGALAGVFLPCGTAGIGAAAAFRFSNPAAALGLLATSGLFSPCRMRVRQLREGTLARDSWSASGRAAYASFAVACACFAVFGTHGFLNPRFAPLVELGAACCALATFRGLRTSTRAAPLVPAALGLALIAGSPPPSAATATLPIGLYPGQSFAFVGRIAQARDARSPTTLERAAILCCRADAQVLSLPLDRRLAIPTHAWISARGVISLRDGRMVLHADRADPVAAPADPYVYL